MLWRFENTEEFIEIEFLHNEDIIPSYPYKDLIYFDVDYYTNETTNGWCSSLLVRREHLIELCYQLGISIQEKNDFHYICKGRGDYNMIDVDVTWKEECCVFKLIVNSSIGFVPMIEEMTLDRLCDVYELLLGYLKDRILKEDDLLCERSGEILLKNDDYLVSHLVTFNSIQLNHIDKDIFEVYAFANKFWFKRFYDIKGNLILDKYDNISVDKFSDGLAKIRVRDIGYGYIDEDYQVVIKPQYDKAKDFHEGLALISQKNPDESGWNKFFINKKGEIINSVEYLYDEDYYDVRDYSDGMCRVSMYYIWELKLAYHSDYLGDAGYWGYINKKGETIIWPEYIFAFDFKNDRAIVVKGEWYNVRENRYWADPQLWGLIDKAGNEIIECVYDEIKEADEIAHYFYVCKDGLWGVMDRNGNTIVTPKFADVGCYDYFENGLLIFYNNDKFNFNNIDGEWVEEFEGLYDATNDCVILEPMYTDIDLYNNHIIATFLGDDKKEHSVLVNRKGEYISKIYDRISYDLEVTMKTKKGDKIGLIDSNGNEIVTPSLEVYRIEKKHKLIIVEKNDKNGLKDYFGNIILPAEFEFLYVFDTVIEVKKENMYGFYSLKGEQLVPCKYQKVDKIYNCNKLMGESFMCYTDKTCEIINIKYLSSLEG